jgi:hypothetical protein
MFTRMKDGKSERVWRSHFPVVSHSRTVVTAQRRGPEPSMPAVAAAGDATINPSTTRAALRRIRMTIGVFIGYPALPR